MNNSQDSYENKVLAFYIRFTQLKAEDFGQIMISASDIYDGLLNLYFNETGVRIDNEPSLEILEILTGNSIKFCFTEGWLPTVYSDNENDIIIGTPKKLGIPILIAYMLLCSAEKIIDVNNKYLDGQLKEYEIRLKQEEINKLRENADSEAFHNLQKKADGFIYTLINNNTFTEITINNTLIKHKNPHEEEDIDVDNND